MCCCKQCPQSPSGLHCFCNIPTGPYWSVVPPTPVCCWCGTSGHGPHRGGWGVWTGGTISINPYGNITGGGMSGGPNGTSWTVKVTPNPVPQYPANGIMSNDGNYAQVSCNVSNCSCQQAPCTHTKK